MIVGRVVELGQREEAYAVFREILRGTLSDIKVVAFLTAMRIKGETPEELLGVIRAIREGIRYPDPMERAIDLALNYDGKNRTLYILPSAVWMASLCGLSFTNHFALRTPTKEGLTLYEVFTSLDVDASIRFADQEDFAPDLYRLMPIRRELGFRSLINTVEKLLNPFGTKKIVVSIFHKPYFRKTEELLDLLGFGDYEDNRR